MNLWIYVRESRFRVQAGQKAKLAHILVLHLGFSRGEGWLAPFPSASLLDGKRFLAHTTFNYQHPFHS